MLVAKRVLGSEREARVYRHLWRRWRLPPAVSLLGQRVAADGTYLFLEDAAPFSDWPWTDVEVAAAVCRELARLHDRRLGGARNLDWDYEAELAASATSTSQLAAPASSSAKPRCLL